MSLYLNPLDYHVLIAVDQFNKLNTRTVVLSVGHFANDLGKLV